MDLQKAIEGRRSIRKYSARPVEDEKLNEVLNAARLAPSASNQQEWRFVVVRDAEKIKALEAAAGGQKFVEEAPVAIAACALPGRRMLCGQPTDTVDVSIAMSFLILKAYELGLGTCWLGHFDAEQVKRILGIPENLSVVALSPLGYPAETPAPRPRKALAEIVHYEKY